jgi:hypothetical protein
VLTLWTFVAISRWVAMTREVLGLHRDCDLCTCMEDSRMLNSDQTVRVSLAHAYPRFVEKKDSSPSNLNLLNLS